MKGESDIEGKQRGNEARAAEKRARSVPEWEELGYTPGVAAKSGQSIERKGVDVLLFAEE